MSKLHEGNANAIWRQVFNAWQEARGAGKGGEPLRPLETGRAVTGRDGRARGGAGWCGTGRSDSRSPAPYSPAVSRPVLIGNHEGGKHRRVAHSVGPLVDPVLGIGQQVRLCGLQLGPRPRLVS